MSTDNVEYCWASHTGFAGMPHPEALRHEGWSYVTTHAIWSDSELWERPAPAPDRVDPTFPASPGDVQVAVGREPERPASVIDSKELAKRGGIPSGGTAT